MSSDLQILELSKEALAQQRLNILEECIRKLELIREKLLHTDRCKLDKDVIWNICGIINGEVSKWDEELLPSSNNIEVSTQAFMCLRNTFINCSTAQLMVAETDELREVIMSSIKWIFLYKQGKVRKVPGSMQVNRQSNDDGALFYFAKSSITCLGNLVAANTSTRRIMWPHLLPLLRPLLHYHEVTISYVSCMVIFNCLLEEDLKKDLCSCSDVDDIICDMLKLYMDEKSRSEKLSCFVLYNLELLLCCDNRVSSVWKSLYINQQVLVLDILSNILEGTSGSKCGSLPYSSVNFLISTFKNLADNILQSHENDSEENNAMVATRLLSFVCLLGASEYWGTTLKEDKSLLITTVSLLQCINEIGSVEESKFSRMNLDDLTEEQRTKTESHPAYGYKRDLIRLIASLVYRHKANQDQVREMGGITLILENSQFDAKNPAIKEASIYAIRNILEGNVENQEIVKNLEYKGVAENQEMQLSHVNDMVVIHKPKSSDDE